MIILDDNNMETIVGGQTLAEYSFIFSVMPNVAEDNPVIQPDSDNLNENAFHGILLGVMLKR